MMQTFGIKSEPPGKTGRPRSTHPGVLFVSRKPFRKSSARTAITVDALKIQDDINDCGDVVCSGVGVMPTRRIIFGAVVATALGCLWSSANAATLLYNDTTASGATGNYPGSVVATFTVNQTGLQVNALAVFDAGRNGISTSSHLMVGLYDDTASGSVAIAAIDFAGTAYNGTGGSYFDTKNLGSAFVLTNGHTYSVEAWGFNATDGTTVFHSVSTDSFNPSTYALTNVPGGSAAGGNAATNIDGNTTGGLLNALFGNTTAYSTYNSLLDPNPCFSSGPICATDATILRFNGTGFGVGGSLVIGVTPIPGALPLFAGGLGVMGLLGWRRKRKASALAA
jgi:hypothetical protein